jgi:hypothetical protein
MSTIRGEERGSRIFEICSSTPLSILLLLYLITSLYTVQYIQGNSIIPTTTVKYQVCNFTHTVEKPRFNYFISEFYW